MCAKSFTVAKMVDRILLERILSEITAEVNDLKNATDITWEVYKTDKRTRRFVERTLHVIIEACIDIGHHIISDEKMREPSSYRDTFTVLAENGILGPSDLERFENMASFRNLLVYYYERVDNEVVFGIFKRDLPDFEFFVSRIVEYLIRINQVVGDS